MEEERHYMRTKQAISAVKTLNEEFATLKKELDVAIDEIKPKLDNGSIRTEIRYDTVLKGLVIAIYYNDPRGYDAQPFRIERDDMCIYIETNTLSAENISTLVEFCKTQILGEYLDE